MFCCYGDTPIGFKYGLHFTFPNDSQLLTANHLHSQGMDLPLLLVNLPRKSTALTQRRSAFKPAPLMDPKACLEHFSTS